MTNEELAEKIFYAVLDDLTDRRGIRQSPLGEMYHIMRDDDPSDDNPLTEPALECHEKNVSAIKELLDRERPALT